MQTNIVERLYNTLFTTLCLESPVLSGNMQKCISLGDYSDEQATVIIEAPFYDMKKWKKEGVIVHTGDIKNGFSDYAYLVNKLGGFASMNKSMNWVNRAVFDVCTAIANEIGAEVINELEL